MVKIVFYIISKKNTKFNIFKYKRKIITFLLFIFILIILNFKCFYKINKFSTLHDFIINFKNSNKKYNYANICCLLKKDENLILTNKALIHISMALDNNLIYPTLISMISFLENNDKDKNLLIYYLLLSSDFNQKKNKNI